MRKPFKVLTACFMLGFGWQCALASPPIGLAENPWGETTANLKQIGFEQQYDLPISKLESLAINGSKRHQKVRALSRHERLGKKLIHEIAVFFERQLVKTEYTLVFPSAHNGLINDILAALKHTLKDQLNDISEALAHRRSGRWNLKRPEEQVGVTLMFDDEGGILKLTRHVAGGQATLNQYEHHLRTLASHAARP